MSSAWDGGFPDQLVPLLKPGDVIFVRGGSWFGSWIVMYLTSSWVSHVATYIGDGDVIHATLGGVRVDSLRALTSIKRDGLLPFLMPYSDDERMAITEEHKRLLGTPYGMRVVAIKVFLILSGRLWKYYRWKFALDLAFLLLAIDACQHWATGRVLAIWAIVPYLVLVTCGALLSKLRPLPFSEWSGVPADLLDAYSESSVTFVGNALGYARRSRFSR